MWSNTAVFDHSGLVDRALDEAAPGMMLSAVNVIYGS